MSLILDSMSPGNRKGAIAEKLQIVTVCVRIRESAIIRIKHGEICAYDGLFHGDSFSCTLQRMKGDIDLRKC